MGNECQCSSHGFCSAFQRDVTEREHKACSKPGSKGEKLRHQWRRELGLLPPGKPLEPLEEAEPPKPHKPTRKPRDIILSLPLCPGDCLVATMALESLGEHRHKFNLGVDCSHNAIFANNPHIQKLDKHAERHKWNYLIPPSRPIHFGQAYTESLSNILGVPLTLATNRPHVYLSEEERAEPPQVEGDYIIINAGTKPDFETKKWNGYQEVVDRLPDVKFVQIGLTKHRHVPLNNVVNLLDKTTLRELILLMHHARLAIGPSTFTQHLAAACSVPYVLIDSAREPASWMTYPLQRSLVKHGSLACCPRGHCWKTKLSTPGSSQCQDIDGELSRCAGMITVQEVVAAIVSYDTH